MRYLLFTTLALVRAQSTQEDWNAVFWGSYAGYCLCLLFVWVGGWAFLLKWKPEDDIEPVDDPIWNDRSWSMTLERLGVLVSSYVYLGSSFMEHMGWNSSPNAPSFWIPQLMRFGFVPFDGLWAPAWVVLILPIALVCCFVPIGALMLRKVDPEYVEESLLSLWANKGLMCLDLLVSSFTLTIMRLLQGPWACAYPEGSGAPGPNATNSSAPHLVAQPEVLCWQSPVQISAAILSFFGLTIFYAFAAVMTLLSKTKNKYTKEGRRGNHAFYKTFNYSREFVASDFQLKLVVTTVATLAVGSEVGDF